jgi:cell division protein ZapA
VSNVTLRIGGRSFQVACAPGEEAHIQNLARIIDDKLSALGAANQSESRMLLFAALMLADELHEQTSAPTPDKRGESWRLAEIADRLENLASELEAAAADD